MRSVSRARRRSARATRSGLAGLAASPPGATSALTIDGPNPFDDSFFTSKTATTRSHIVSSPTSPTTAAATAAATDAADNYYEQPRLAGLRQHTRSRSLPRRITAAPTIIAVEEPKAANKPTTSADRDCRPTPRAQRRHRSLIVRRPPSQAAASSQNAAGATRALPQLRVTLDDSDGKQASRRSRQVRIVRCLQSSTTRDRASFEPKMQPARKSMKRPTVSSRLDFRQKCVGLRLVATRQRPKFYFLRVYASKRRQPLDQFCDRIVRRCTRQRSYGSVLPKCIRVACRKHAQILARHVQTLAASCATTSSRAASSTQLEAIEPLNLMQKNWGRSFEPRSQLLERLC